MQDWQKQQQYNNNPDKDHDTGVESSVYDVNSECGFISHLGIYKGPIYNIAIYDMMASLYNKISPNKLNYYILLLNGRVTKLLLVGFLDLSR